MDQLYNHLIKISIKKENDLDHNSENDSGYDKMMKFYTKGYNDNMQEYLKIICCGLKKYKDKMTSGKISFCVNAEKIALNEWVVVDIVKEFYKFGYELKIERTTVFDNSNGWYLFYLTFEIFVINK